MTWDAFLMAVGGFAGVSLVAAAATSVALLIGFCVGALLYQRAELDDPVGDEDDDD